MTTCSECKFYDEKTSRKDAAEIDNGVVRARGKCRRHAPQIGKWPQVYADDWCGEYERA